MVFRETMKDGTIINRNEQEEEYAKSEHEVCNILFYFFIMYNLINCLIRFRFG